MKKLMFDNVNEVTNRKQRELEEKQHSYFSEHPAMPQVFRKNNNNKFKIKAHLDA